MYATSFLRKGVWFCVEAMNLLKQESRKRLISYSNSKRKLPKRHYCYKQKTERLLKDGIVWVQVLPQLRRKWIRKYAILSEERFSYHREKPEEAAKTPVWNMIRVSDLISVKIPRENHFIFENWNSKTLYIKVWKKKSKIKILLKCGTEEERDLWMAALLKAKSIRLMKDYLLEATQIQKTSEL